MFKILSQPYPYPQQTLLRPIVQSVLEGFFIAGFLIVFQPFGIVEWQHSHKIVLLSGFGIITITVALIIRIILPTIFKKYFVEKDWTIGRETLVMILYLGLITICNLLYSDIIFDLFFTWQRLGWMSFNVLLLGFFPISFGIMANYIYKLKKYSQPVVIAPPSAQSMAETNHIIRLIAENDKYSLEINAEDLFFIESSDNYSTIYFLRNNTLQKKLLRSSLSRLEMQITYPKIVRCHRSYIVNMDRVARVSGNAQGYKFHLHPTDLTVPVARKYSKLVEKLR